MIARLLFLVLVWPLLSPRSSLLDLENRAAAELIASVGKFLQLRRQLRAADAGRSIAQASSNPTAAGRASTRIARVPLGGRTQILLLVPRGGPGVNGRRQPAP